MKSSLRFLLLSLLFFSCSRKGDVDLLKEGKAAEDQGNYQLAVERYQEIVDRFPGSVSADSALYRTAVVYNNDTHDYAKAVQTYRKYCAMFPASKDAPTALFLSGFILNNELHQLDSAKMVYESFLEKYPAHPLASSARFELETLGKDPGQFIKSEAAAQDEPAKKPGKPSAK